MMLGLPGIWTHRGQPWAKLLALPQFILNTRVMGLVMPHPAEGDSEAQGGDKAAGETQGRDLGPGHQTPDTPGAGDSH